jgi:hypothetical protein
LTVLVFGPVDLPKQRKVCERETPDLRQITHVSEATPLRLLHNDVDTGAPQDSVETRGFGSDRRARDQAHTGRTISEPPVVAGRRLAAD